MKKKSSVFLSVLVIPVFFSGIFAGFSPCKEAAPAPVTLEFWSVFDDSDVYQPLIDEYKQLYPHVTVNYYKKSINTYERDLIDALASGRGPDIFSIQNTWLPKHKDKLAELPSGSITSQRYQEVFVDVAAKDFIDNGKIYALPFSVDTLALFYNKDLLNSAGVARVPATWEQFNAAVEKLTTLDAKGNIVQAGAAIGTAKNINRSTDILMALMIQSGSKMISDDKTLSAFEQPVTNKVESFDPGERALSFYTNFASPQKKVYTWNSYQHYSLDAFIEGKAAMIFNYAYQAPSLKARSPHLDFGVASLPQISETGTKVNYANYWGQAVSKDSKNQAAAWQFLMWLAGAEPQKKYLAATGKPPARRDLIDEMKNDPNVGLFAQQALSARSWMQIDNVAIERIFGDMIESVVSGKVNSVDALRAAGEQVDLLMSKANKTN